MPSAPTGELFCGYANECSHSWCRRIRRLEEVRQSIFYLTKREKEIYSRVSALLKERDDLDGTTDKEPIA